MARSESIKTQNEESSSPGNLLVQVMESDIVPQDLGGSCDPTKAPCWSSHFVPVEPQPCWQRISLPFEDFKQPDWGIEAGELDLDQISSITFLVEPNRTYDYWIDELAFYSDEPPAPAEEMECTGMGGAGGATGE